MRQLIVRKLEDWVVQRLRQRAAANGRSAEEEHRAILRAALKARRNFDGAFTRVQRLRAGHHSRQCSVDIHRRALTRRSKQAFKDILGAMPDVGADEDFTPPRDRPRRVKL